MADPNPNPPAPPEPPAPPANPPAPPADDDTITALVEQRIKAALDKITKGNPPAPPAEPPAPGANAPSAADIDAMIAKALAGRDREDQVAMLAEQLAEVRGELDKATKPVRNWATLLLGAPFNRR